MFGTSPVDTARSTFHRPKLVCAAVGLVLRRCSKLFHRQAGEGSKRVLPDFTAGIRTPLNVAQNNEMVFPGSIPDEVQAGEEEAGRSRLPVQWLRMGGPASRRKVLTFGLIGVCLTFAALAFLPPPAAVPEPVGRTEAAPLGDISSLEPMVQAQPANGPAFQRPIFLPSRRLPDQEGPAAGIAVEGLKLRAVFLGPDTKKAFITTNERPEGQWVRIGQPFEGWRVEAIRPKMVVLAGAGGREELKLEKPETIPGRNVAPSARQRPALAGQKRDGVRAAPAHTEDAPE